MLGMTPVIGNFPYLLLWCFQSLQLARCLGRSGNVGPPRRINITMNVQNATSAALGQHRWNVVACCAIVRRNTGSCYNTRLLAPCPSVKIIIIIILVTRHYHAPPYAAPRYSRHPVYILLPVPGRFTGCRIISLADLKFSFHIPEHIVSL